MADYEYTAKSINGRRMKGKIQAQDRDQAWIKIRGMGLYPVKLKEEREESESARSAVACLHGL